MHASKTAKDSDHVMVGTDIDHISITRRLPIEGEALGDVLARLRAETSGTTLHWNLGTHGSCDVDVMFGPSRAAGARNGVWQTTAQLHGPGPSGGAAVDVSVTGCGPRESQLVFRPADPATLRGRLELANAAIEELAQELLFQHSRVRDELAS
jgi:hypothetical protein